MQKLPFVPDAKANLTEYVIEKGLDGLRAKVAERRSRINLTVLDDLHGDQFLKAIDIVLEAVSLHIKRFADLAREMAATETRDSRRDELPAPVREEAAPSETAEGAPQ